MQTKNGGEIIDTTRRYPRTLREVLPATENATGITGPVVTPTRPPLWVRVLRRADAWLIRWAQFRRVFAQYRKQHPIHYAARIAWGVAFRNLPF